ncbi:hypothetical protein OAS39_06605 [Pirellulales bacterium]|nr:hypothetical protein [Pirellulales bacterium]
MSHAMAETSILPPEWQVPPQFRSRLGARVGRQRPMTADGHLLLVLHTPPLHDDPVRVGRFFWRAPDGSWKSKEQGDGIQALDKLLDEYEDQISTLDRQEAQATTADAYFAVLENLAPLHRAARNMYRVLQEARKAFPEYGDLIDARDRAYAIERTADLLYSEIKNSLDFLIARRAEEQAVASNRMAAASHRLNMLAAMFFPIITFTSIVGLDIETIGALFGVDDETMAAPRAAPLVFVGVLGFGLIVGAILTMFVNRRPPDAGGPKPRG